MAVDKVKDPISKKNLTLAEGKVEGVYFNPLKEIKSYTGRQGSAWTPTHSINLKVDGDYINLGLTDNETLRCRDVDEKFHDVVAGCEVSVVITEVGEYNGKPTYSSLPKHVTITEVVEATQKQSGNTNNFSGKRDYTGVEVGHAINCALEMLSHQFETPEELISLSQKVHGLTATLKEDYKAKNPAISDYDAGAAVGHAVLNACKTYAPDDIDLVSDYVWIMLDRVVPEVLAFIKGYNSEEEKPEPKKPAKKKASTQKKAAPPKEPDPEPEYEEDEGNDDYYDDDIPF